MSAESNTESGLNEDLFNSYLEGDYFASQNGKVVAITGTTTGLGLYLSRVAVAREADIVLLLNRKSERSDKAEADLKELVKEGSSTDIRTINCDMMSIESVRKAAEEVNEIANEHGGLDVLCNNAGIMAYSDKRTKDGFDVQMQTNQLSPFLLTNLVFKSLEMAAEGRGEARVVMHSSSARNTPHGALEEKYFLKCEEGTLGGEGPMALQMVGLCGGPWVRYHQTKLANSAFAMALHKKLKVANSKVKSLVAEPGAAQTSLQDTEHFPWLMSKFMPMHSAADGSLNVTMACFNSAAKSGDFFAPEKQLTGKPVLVISGGVPVKKGSEKQTCDPANQKMVWDACEKALGIEFKV